MRRSAAEGCSTRRAKGVGAALTLALLAARAAACPWDEVGGTAAEPQVPAVPTLEELRPMKETCLRSANYFRLLGVALMSAGDAQAAADSLERALLLDPNDLDALADYARALSRSGDRESAAAVLDQLMRRHDLPPPTRHAVRSQLDQLVLEPSPWMHRWQAGVEWAFDDNLNNAPLASAFTLTLPQADVVLSTAPTSRPQAGAAMLAQWQWTGLRPQGRALWVVQIDGQGRHADASDHQYLQADASLAWLQSPEARSQWMFRAGTSQLHWAGQALYQTAQGTFQHQWFWPDEGCRVNLGPSWELRHHPRSVEADGQFVGALGATQCRRLGGLWQVQLQLGVDEPQSPQRAGGRFHQQQWRASWQRAWNRWRVEARYQLSHQRDGSGYSPLLERGARRSLVRHGASVELSVPVASAQPEGLSAYVALEASRQYSNLQPFDSARKAIRVGFRHQW